MNKKPFEDILKALKNKERFGLVIGKVVSDFPNIKIDIGSGIVLDKDDLVFSASILKGYQRQYKITSTDAQIKGNQLNSSGNNWSLAGAPIFNDANGTLGTVPVTNFPLVASNWSTDATTFDANSNDFKSTGTLEFTDEIVLGDLVVLMATESNQLFYVMDKAVSF